LLALLLAQSERSALESLLWFVKESE
jgi:hypothetical protein